MRKTSGRSSWWWLVDSRETPGGEPATRAPGQALNLEAFFLVQHHPAVLAIVSFLSDVQLTRPQLRLWQQPSEVTHYADSDDVGAFLHVCMWSEDGISCYLVLHVLLWRWPASPVMHRLVHHNLWFIRRTHAPHLMICVCLQMAVYAAASQSCAWDLLECASQHCQARLSRFLWCRIRPCNCLRCPNFCCLLRKVAC